MQISQRWLNFLIILIGITLELDGSDKMKLNSKLRKEQFIKSSLFDAYLKSTLNPHDDRLEISARLEKDTQNVTYDFEEKDQDDRNNNMINAMEPIEEDEEHDGEEQDIVFGTEEDVFFSMRNIQ